MCYIKPGVTSSDVAVCFWDIAAFNRGGIQLMPTIDSDAHVVETEHTWDFMERADQKYRPLIVRPRGEGGGEYWFIDGKIRGLVRIVMTARELADVSARTGRAMETPRETREMENVPARLKHMD